MKIKILAIVAVLSVPIFPQSFRAQDDTPPNGVMAGPFGYPRAVLDEGAKWSAPIQIHAMGSKRYYIPDITTGGWAQWHMDEFKSSGKYSVPLYIYDTKNQQTINYLLQVDTKGNTAVLMHWLVGAVIRVNLKDKPTALSTAIVNTTDLVRRQINNYKGTSLQQYLDAEKLFTLREFMCSTGNRPNPDCNLSTEEFAKKYAPSFVSRPPKLLPGAIPGVNCGVGFDKSCAQ